MRNWPGHIARSHVRPHGVSLLTGWYEDGCELGKIQSLISTAEMYPHLRTRLLWHIDIHFRS